MKGLFTVLIVAVMVLGFSAAGFAEGAMTTGSGMNHNMATQKNMEPMENSGMSHSSGMNHSMATQKKTEPMEKTMTYSGTVVSLNTTDHTLIVKGKEGEKTFDVSKVTTLNTVKTGHTVKVVYATENGKMVASSVNVGVKTSMKKSAKG